MFAILLVGATLQNGPFPLAEYFGMSVGAVILAVITGPLGGWALRRWSRLDWQPWGKRQPPTPTDIDRQ